MYKFTMSSMLIKSSWFDGNKKSMFQKMGKAEGFNLYLQLFRFRFHQGDINEHYFRLSIGELKQFTKVNVKKKLSLKKIAEMLETFEKLGIVKNHSFKDWKNLYDDEGNVKGDKTIVLEATDVPDTIRKDEKDKNVTQDDMYIRISFELVDHIYSQGLTSDALALFYLIRKWSNNPPEHKAWLNINTMKDKLGVGNDKIVNGLKELNKLGVMATSVRHKNGGVKYEHHPVIGGVSKIEGHVQVHKPTIEKFLKRYEEDSWGVETKEEENPFQ